MRRDLEEAVERLAGGQHGVITVRQGLGIGLTYHMIEYRVGTGRWERRSKSAIIVRPPGSTWKTELMVGVLSVPCAMVSGRAAARLWGLGRFGDGPIEVTAPFASNARGDGFVVRRCRHFDHLAWRRLDGIPVMDVPDLLCDMARRESGFLVARLLEQAVLERKSTLDEMVRVSADRVGNRCPGGRSLSRLVATLDGEPVIESELERVVLSVLSDGRLPAVKRQMEMPFLSQVKGRVDFAIPEWRLVIECDGRRWHSREQDFERDRARDNAAVAAGWRVLRFTYSMLTTSRAACLELILKTGSQAA